jgi:hypothetical protein
VLKPLGYAISSLSVVLLGIVAWDGASQKPLLVACLAAGMATSIVGMGFRLASFLREEAEKRREAAVSGVATLRDRGAAGAPRARDRLRA